MNKLEESDIIYTAGIFDGEGWIGMNTERSLGIRIVSTNYKLIEWLQAKWGGYIYKRKPYENSSSKKQSYDWYLTKQENVEIFSEKIYPYLIIKREQIGEAFEKRKLFLEKRTDRGWINSNNVKKRWSKIH